MKRIGSKTLVLLAVAAVMVACTKPQKGITSIEGLKPVVYNQEAAKEISAKKTGHVLPDPTTGGKQERVYSYLAKTIFAETYVGSERDGWRRNLSGQYHQGRLVLERNIRSIGTGERI